MAGTTRGVVAGFDGSPGSADALRWATGEAEARGTALTVCLAWPDGIEGMSLGSVAQAVLHHAPCPVGIVHQLVERLGEG